jgi:hypothetical protein
MEAIDTPPSQPGAVTMFFKRIGEVKIRPTIPT